MNSFNEMGQMPLVDFAPNAKYGVTVWSLSNGLFGGDVSAIKSLSLSMCIVICSILLAACAVRSYRSAVLLDPLLLIACPIALFILFFYQHNSEYSVLIGPLCLLIARSYKELFLIWAVIAFAWVPKVLFGIKNIGLNNANASMVRNELLQFVTDYVPLNFDNLHQLSLVLYTVLWALLTAYLIYLLLREPEKKPI